MDKSFTFRFYDVARPNHGAPQMIDMLRNIFSVADVTQREKLLSINYTVRLENLENDGPDAVVGELTRCQNTNLPAQLDAGGRSELDVDRLGHSIVFRYNHRLNAIGIQYDPRIVSPGKFLSYLASFNAAAIYRVDPRINRAAWQKFNSGSTRKLCVRIHNPDDMRDLSGNAAAASSAIRAMGEAYAAPSVYVEISMGNHRGFLSQAINGLAQQLANMNFPGVSLDKLSVVSVINDETEEIDLIEDRVVAREVLEIHDKNPDINWQIKRDYICRTMQGMIG